MKKNILIVLAVFLLVLVYFLRGSNGASVAYQDKNKNLIWDDLEGYISENSNTPQERQALEYMFKTYQFILLNPESALKFKDNHGPTDFARAYDCFRSTHTERFPDGTGPKDKILSTWARHRAWAKYNANLSGGVYHSWQEERDGKACPF